ncbi:MAG: hypothetical protein GX567_10065 [Clostridia bacterium]|nr:hypothetical protein [Clostridia bacterium]
MKRTIATLFIAIGIIVAIIFLKNTYSCEIPIGSRGIKAAIDSGNLDLLFIGSSSFRSNIDMEVMDEEYQGKAFIIAYGGNQIVSSQIEYEEICNRSNHEYKQIIFELDPLMLTEDVDLSDSRIIWDLSWSGKQKLWSKLQESESTDLSSMYEFFVTSGMDDLITYPITNPIYKARYYKGSKTGEIPSSGKEYLENEPYDLSNRMMNSSQEKALRELIQECKNNNQKILFLETPHYHRLFDEPVYQEYREIFCQILSEYEIPFILSDMVEFDQHNPDYFEDMGHMSSIGREEYTENLIKELD